MNPVTSSISSLQGLPHKPVSAKPSVALKDINAQHPHPSVNFVESPYNIYKTAASAVSGSISTTERSHQQQNPMSRQPVISQSVSHGSLGNHQLQYLNAHGRSMIESISSNVNGVSNRNSLVRSGLAVQDLGKGGVPSLKQGTVASGAVTSKKKSKSKNKGASQRDNPKPKLIESV
jgi:hypothetical protein